MHISCVATVEKENDVARPANDTLTLVSNIPGVWAGELRQFVGGLIDQALSHMQPNFAVAITPDNRLHVQVVGLNITSQTFRPPEDPDNIRSKEVEEISPHEARLLIVKAFEDAKLNPKVR